MTYHISVLLNELVSSLNPEKHGTYLDLTFGAGGHSRRLLEVCEGDCHIIAFDKDENSQRNKIDHPNFTLIHADFSDAAPYVKALGIDSVQGIMADLGVSSFQLDHLEQGFSYRTGAPLDMRMNKAQSLTASQILMTYDEAQLKDIFEKYGQVRNAITLAQEIIQSRSIKALKYSQDLNEILEKIKFGSFESYAAPVYQALRIEVNDELGSLARSLPTWVDLLSPKGRLSIITFHSLEDRIVKDFFSQSKVAHQEDPNYLLFGQKPKTPWKIITKKPISPSYEEVATNSRSRSAKIRTIEKI